MKKIDQAEINYIFRKLDSYNQRTINADSDIVKVLTKNPIAALVATWNTAYGRAGLSPFTLHYLLQSELPVDKWTEKNLLNTKTVNYGYCHSTRLPVVSPYIRLSWTLPLTVRFIRPTPVGIYDRNYFKKLKETREARFEELHAQLKDAQAAGLADDEYMRRFGGFPIAKPTWQHLKGVAGIYL